MNIGTGQIYKRAVITTILFEKIRSYEDSFGITKRIYIRAMLIEKVRFPFDKCI